MTSLLSRIAARTQGRLLVVLTVFVGTFVAPSLVSAETPTEVIEVTADHGLFVASQRSDIDPSQFDSALSSATDGGINLVIVAPIDPQPTARSFALRVRQRGEDIDAVLVVDVEGVVHASVGEEFEDAEGRAIDVAQQYSSAPAAADAFVHELRVELVVGDPPLYSRLANIAVLLMIALSAAVVLEILWVQAKKRFLAGRQESRASEN